MHTFPLPDPETTKLERVAKELRRQIGRAKLKHSTRANSWPLLLLVLAMGILAGKLGRSRLLFHRRPTC